LDEKFGVKMQRTLNYTGRERIEKNQALFSFTDPAATVPEFNVALHLDSSKYPSNASVFIEAYHKETRQRFNFGTVGNIRPPSDRLLDKIDLSRPTSFRVLIVDSSEKEGMLLASGDHFRADDSDEEQRSSILPVHQSMMGDLTWKVHFELGAAPELHINNKIIGGIEKVRSDPTFQALILPAALREILTCYMWLQVDPEEDEYCGRWIAFANLFGDEVPESNDPLEIAAWIDEVVSSFSERFHLVDLLENALPGAD
jgi:hypothetical protein